ncbi:unnamed protein product [Adineta steineri]|uniref:Uncharacterized protein n=1 Tax=Adineta steineri TaxID=433720 RepID=A0A815W6C1_9BILA|nr:unnamed protein product [Adineta steineri]CAF1541876.1 unnamed protein product [Adineta steineri]
MYSNGTAGSISIQYQNANPLLYSLPQDHMTIQPYWIMVLQLIGMQLFLRLWNLYRYHVFLTTTEIAFIRWVLSFHKETLRRTSLEVLRTAEKIERDHRGPLFSLIFRGLEQSEKSQELRDRLRGKVDFDVFDFVFQCLPLCGHGIWYCHIQSSCMSAEYATTWNCYNAFGYRIYNYIFVSYSGFFTVFIIKLIALLENRKTWIPATNWQWFAFHLGLFSSIITFVFIGALILPYLLTHVLPMVFAYIHFSIVYFALLSTIFISTGVLFQNFPESENVIVLLPKYFPGAYRPIAGFSYIIAFGLATYPILLSTLYNYSEYLYYSENYIYTMSNEFNTRDTSTYIGVFQNSVNQRLHTFLDFV